MTKNQKYRLVAILLLIIALAVILLFALIKKSNSRSDLPANVNPTSNPNDNSLNAQRKTSSNPSSTLTNGPTSSGSPSTNSSSPSAILTITRADIVNGNLQVGTLVSGTTTGTCVLSLTQNGQADIKSTANIVLDNNSYSCPVFNVPLTSFPNRGSWNVSVSLFDNNNTITSNWDNNPVNLSSYNP